VQAFVAADIRASRLLFITTAILPGTLTVPGRSFCCPGTRSSTGTRTSGYPLTGLVISLHIEMFLLPDGGCVSKIIRLFVEGKLPAFPDKVSSATADSAQDRDSRTTDERVLVKQGLLLAFCAGGLLTSYLVWGLLQERIMAFNYSETESTSERFTNSQFLVFMNRIFALCVAVLVIAIQRRHSSHQPPLYKYSYGSFSNIISSWCQYEALKFVSFPVQVSMLGTAHVVNNQSVHLSVSTTLPQGIHITDCSLSARMRSS